MTQRRILHLDMDAFFAAVELLEHPELAGRPVVVGGAEPRGVVAAASYPARVFGIRSAMAGVTARRLCPDAVFLPPRLDRYREVSGHLMAILRSITPLVEPLALDEAFLDVTGAVGERAAFATAQACAVALRTRVVDELNLHCSIGVSTSKMLAKLASEAAKPRVVGATVHDGQGVVVVPPGRELEFLHPHPVGALWGVGAATQAKLHRLGVERIGDLAALPESAVVHALGSGTGAHVWALSQGVDDRPVVPDRPMKSISHEETFAEDQFDATVLQRELTRLADRVASRVRSMGQGGRTVVLKVRLADLRVVSRSSSFADPVDDGQLIAHTAQRLLTDVDITSGVRLIGVGLAQLAANDERQLQLPWGEAPPERQAANRVIDSIRARFGAQAIQSGAASTAPASTE